MAGSAGSPRLGQSNSARSVAVASSPSQERSQSPPAVDAGERSAVAAKAAAGVISVVSETTEANRPALVTNSRRELRFPSSVISLSLAEVCSRLSLRARGPSYEAAQ